MTTSSPYKLYMILGCIVLTFSGCSVAPVSQQPRYFLLDTGELTAREPGATTAIAVGPVHVAEYLDQPTLVVRDVSGALVRDELSRWAVTLQEQIGHAVRVGLEGASRSVVTAPFPAHNADYAVRVAIRVHRFEATEEGRAELAAEWTAFNNRGEILPQQSGRFNDKTSVPGYGIETILAAQSRLLIEFARAIAVAVVPE